MALKLIHPTRHEDDRGWFTEPYNKATFEKYGIYDTFVQDSHSFSRKTDTVRGFHFQAPPFDQVKTMRCIAGGICNFVLDIRVGSPTYGKYMWTILTAKNGRMLYIPSGFAVGFMTAESDTEVEYKVSTIRSADHDRGINFQVVFPVGDSTISDKDRNLPKLLDFVSPFVYDGVPFSITDYGA